MSPNVRRAAGLCACLVLLSTTACDRLKLGGAPAPKIDTADATPIEIDATVTGEITSANRVNYNDGSRSVTYSFELPEGKAVSIEASAAFCGQLSLFSEDGTMRRERSSGECRESEGRHVISRSLIGSRGTRHTLAFSGRGPGDYGPFSLQIKPLEIASERELVAGDDVSGLLDGERQTLTLKVEQAGRYQLDLLSSEFDPALRLEGEGTDREDDDGGDGTNARVVAYLEAGTYRVHVSRVGDGGGLFQLQVERREMNLPEGTELQNDGDLAVGTPVRGMLQGAANEYRLVVAERARYELSLESDDYDVRLDVAGPNTRLSDDDGGEGTDSRLIVVLDPGTYTVTAGDIEENFAGMYTLQAKVSPAGEPARLAPGATQEATLVEGEQHRYAFSVGARGSYTIDMRSSQFDSMLLLLRDGEPVNSDDDSGGESNARLEGTLDPGEYEVVALSFGGGSGRYRIGVEAR